MTDAQHHLHKRKRIHKEYELYPHPVTWKRYLDYAVYMMGIISPLMTFPQVFEIWQTKSAEGVSPLTWGTYFFSSIVWLAYGITHKEKPIILSNALYILIIFFILIGIGKF